MLQYRDKYPYLRGMIASVGFRRIIVPYNWRKRERGKSRLNLMMLTDQAMNGIFSFSSAPMRACTLLGFTMSTLCLAYSVSVTVAAVFGFTDAPRGTVTLIVALFFLSGIQMLFIGMLGEYVTAIHRQTKGGPLVVEREIINLRPLGRD